MLTKHLAAFLAAFCMLIFVSCDKDNMPSSESLPNTESSIAASSEDGDIPSGIAIPGISAENYPRVDGSTANMPLMAKLYSEVCGVPLDQAETLVQVSGGTGAVWRNMMYEGADLLLVYEAPENIKVEMEGMGLWDEFEVSSLGRDGLVFLVNAQNPVNNLTREQLIGIYTGGITDWSEAGGDSVPIAAFQRNLESGSQTLFLRLLMKDVEPIDPPSELRPAGMGALIDAVAEYDGSGGAIGFSVFYYANLMYENPNLKLLSVDNVEPSAESIENGSYPLVNDFYVVIRKNEPANSPARLLRDWLLTDEGRQLLIDENYVPIRQVD
ncbi:PstS family phosphate ABC transporter substrate-binding protein [Marasmitruncus massiliensis]|uniref:PstS family phosphate ABC transporter substrate-binding protein n=1 Tax=Marasmitruncus massiliensis TaxID=1944642 RepID=UPI000C7C53A8|nr:substrate-binding domain-containing protein [Marasmitruncus massiliensis]